ncbi:hypothetical protein [Taylorella asinigenitalis]|uniref:hypothetical protein n=1 Tax=Taylorella asinigenitalis TaxID=84590 RepID=UPI001651006C|nr:hypothetical protein [Taylorella asinigenitalis]
MVFFNKLDRNQKDGLANFFDLISVPSLIAFVLDMFGFTQLSKIELVALLVVFVLLFTCSLTLRRLEWQEQ